MKILRNVCTCAKKISVALIFLLMVGCSTQDALVDEAPPVSDNDEASDVSDSKQNDTDNKDMAKSDERNAENEFVDIEGMKEINLGDMSFYVPDDMEVEHSEAEGAYEATAVAGSLNLYFSSYTGDLEFSLRNMDDELRNGFAAKTAEDAGISPAGSAVCELGGTPFVVYALPGDEETGAKLSYLTVEDGRFYCMIAVSAGRDISQSDAAFASMIAMTLQPKSK